MLIAEPCLVLASQGLLGPSGEPCLVLASQGLLGPSGWRKRPDRFPSVGYQHIYFFLVYGPAVSWSPPYPPVVWGGFGLVVVLIVLVTSNNSSSSSYPLPSCGVVWGGFSRSTSSISY